MMKCSKCGAESVEGDKFCATCGTPLAIPSVPKLKQSETGRQYPVSSIASGYTKLLKLTCPSCGGSLELPDNLTVAHCIYCGTKILLDQEGVVHERRDLSRYIELCKVAVEAKNHTEVIEYCNRILELDPKNIEAWINKAVSTFWLTTGAHNRYDEAMEYLKKASQIAQDDERVVGARETLRKKQAWWLNNLGNQQWESGVRIYKIDPYSEQRGRDASKPYAIKAMNYYLAASDLDPYDMTILGNITDEVKQVHWIQWSEKVYAKIKSLELLQTKRNALAQLARLNGELQKAESDLARLQTQSGFLVGGKIKDAERRIARLQTDIAKQERDAAYDPLQGSK